MNMVFRSEAALFGFWEYMFRTFATVHSGSGCCVLVLKFKKKKILQKALIFFHTFLSCCKHKYICYMFRYSFRTV
jgi:hypothetical protein